LIIIVAAPYDIKTPALIGVVGPLDIKSSFVLQVMKTWFCMPKYDLNVQVSDTTGDANSTAVRQQTLHHA